MKEKKNNIYQSKLYSIFHNIKYRCYNKNCHAYKNYGGRGISICEEWLRYESFYNWAIKNGYKEGLSIDRIDNDKNYCPDNCQWITRGENTAKANKRKEKYFKIWIMVSPEGKVVKINNMSKFCRDKNLRDGNMRQVHNGDKKSHQGWTKYVEDKNE